MDYMRKRVGGGVQWRLRRRMRSATTKMTWDGTYFLVSINVRLDGRVCNALLIFIAHSSPSLLSTYGAVDVPSSLAKSADEDNTMVEAGVGI